MKGSSVLTVQDQYNDYFSSLFSQTVEDLYLDYIKLYLLADVDKGTRLNISVLKENSVEARKGFRSCFNISSSKKHLQCESIHISVCGHWFTLNWRTECSPLSCDSFRSWAFLQVLASK